eukprot:635553-Lingulodinium_polyedra.AAC.1
MAPVMVLHRGPTGVARCSCAEGGRRRVAMRLFMTLHSCVMRAFVVIPASGGCCCSRADRGRAIRA